MIIDRRRFLKALGLGGAAAAMPGGLIRDARASGEAPKRLIVVSTCHGTVYDGWKMRPGGNGDVGTWEHDLSGLSESDFSRALQPLHPYRDRTLVLDGLSMISAEKDLPGYRHEKGWIHAWTGAPVYFTGSNLFATEASLDQIVAAEIARADRLPSLELMVGEGRPISHAGLAQQLPMEGSPAQVYERMFGLAGSTDPLIAAQGSALDFALAEYDALSPRLSANDADRLGAHFDLVRQLEQRIQGLASVSCESGIDVSQLASSASDTYDAVFKSMADLIGAAFSCDMTRVVSLSLGDMASDDFGWGHYLSGDAHNDFAHQIHLDAGAAEAMTDYTRQHAEQLAYLVALLESLPDSDGGSVMDNTLIVWGGELGDGWHGYRNWCALTIGGSWYFRPGRYLHAPMDSTRAAMIVPEGESETAGLPHNQLLVSVANAMGVPVDAVGQDALTDTTGEHIDLSGELPNMT